MINALSAPIKETLSHRRDPRPVYHPVISPDQRRTVHRAIRAAAEAEGFSPGEGFGIATAVAVRTIDAQPGAIAEAAAKMFAAILRGTEPLPVVFRPAGCTASARWLECEAAPKWRGKSYADSRAA